MTYRDNRVERIKEASRLIQHAADVALHIATAKRPGLVAALTSQRILLIGIADKVDPQHESPAWKGVDQAPTRNRLRLNVSLPTTRVRLKMEV